MGDSLYKMQLPIGRTIVSTLHFTVTHWMAILNRIVVPVVGGWLILYFLLSGYLFELDRYLRSPSLRPASMVLGIAMAGILITLFLNAIVVVAVAEFAMSGGRESGKLRFRVARPEWRFYAASLRVLVVAAVLTGMYLGVSKAAMALGMGAAFGTLWHLVMGTAFFYVAVRLSFLMAPVTLAERGAILRRAWALSAVGHWRGMAVGAILALSGPLIEIVGELVLRLAGKVPVLHSGITMASAVAMFHGLLPVFLILAAIAYAAGTVLFTVGSVRVYRIAVDAEYR